MNEMGGTYGGHIIIIPVQEEQEYLNSIDLLMMDSEREANIQNAEKE